jgi:K+-transporting ATPase KdpF subunit
MQPVGEGIVMDVMHVLAAGLACGLFGYLLFALLSPERFS